MRGSGGDGGSGGSGRGSSGAVPASNASEAAAAAASGGSSGSGGGGGDDWQLIDLPWARFLPTLRGRVVPAREALDGGRVRQLGFMLSKVSAAGGSSAGFREGAFCLAVRGVRGIP